MLLIAGGSRHLLVVPFWVPFRELEDFLLALYRDLSGRTVRCGHCLGLHRCHWSHTLVHQHLTSTRAWPNCEFTSQSLAILAKQHCNRIAHILVHHSSHQAASRPHRCQRDRPKFGGCCQAASCQSQVCPRPCWIVLVNHVDAPPRVGGGEGFGGWESTIIATF
jgi:hypothetical protein